MKISVKTAGVLGRYLPPGSAGNFADLDIVEGRTPIDVMKQLGMPLEDRYLVVLNDTVKPQSDRSHRTLTETDSLAIMPSLNGG